MIRQGNEVSLLFQAGESYNKKEAEEYFKNKTRESLENSISPYKKSLGLKLEYEGDPKVVNFMNNDKLWPVEILQVFDKNPFTVSQQLPYQSRLQHVTAFD